MNELEHYNGYCFSIEGKSAERCGSSLSLHSPSPKRRLRRRQARSAQSHAPGQPRLFIVGCRPR